jgi:Asp-tRNA(Asn)/Glu-tRNA(Gln) amidotransferase A subunit family amidase
MYSAAWTRDKPRGARDGGRQLTEFRFTTAIPPVTGQRETTSIRRLEQDEDYRRLNALLLRNTSVINFLDRCAITVPIRTVGAPVGLMIVGEHGEDRHLLGVGRGIEAALNRVR